ncbi:MAG: hypothetical protein ACREFJ_19420 [Acetobacteraceae bacterium]
MSEVLNALILLVLLMLSAAFGMSVKVRLPERHRSRETWDLVTLVVTMLVTFAALVMGLLTYSVKGGFDRDNADVAALAGQIVQLDHSLRNYGPEALVARIALRRYTESAIASTWPGEPLPPGVEKRSLVVPTIPLGIESPRLGAVLNGVGQAIYHLAPNDALHRKLAASCIANYRNLVAARWTLIEDARPTISVAFYVVLVFWLVVIFVCFGLNAPRTSFVFIIITLSAISIVSAMFVILEMDTPFTGYILVSSHPMRNALADITRSEPVVPPVLPGSG